MKERMKKRREFKGGVVRVMSPKKLGEVSALIFRAIEKADFSQSFASALGLYFRKCKKKTLKKEDERDREGKL